MVLVVNVAMGVNHDAVNVPVLVPLGQVQIYADTHKCGCCTQ